jgi:glycosyltransferase involved in cell wall biosynthesis
MRIAIVGGPHIPVPPPKYGGIEQVTHYLIKGLLELGHEPVLLGTGDSTIDCEVVPIVDEAIYFPKKRSELPAFQKRLVQIEKKTKQILKKVAKQVDIIHSHGFDLSDFQNYPCLTTIHNKIDFEWLLYYLKRRDLYYVSISQNQQYACPDLNYIGVVYNGEDPKNFPMVKKPEEYVCFLGRFDRDKNPHLAIQLAINMGIKIKVAGKIDFHDDGYFDEEVKELLEHPLVEYLGELDFAQKVELLSKAKCNLHPAGFREPFGLTVIEAAYCGTPTLAIARGAMPELIEEGRTGSLVEDFIEGYNRIDQCFEMDREYIAQRARLLFNYRTMTQQYIKAYERVIEIFKARNAQNHLIKGLTKQARAELQEIWRTNNQRSATGPIAR